MRPSCARKLAKFTTLYSQRINFNKNSLKQRVEEREWERERAYDHEIVIYFRV